MKTSKRAPGPLHSNTRLHQCSISSRHDLPRNVLHCILVGTFWKFLWICRQLLFFFLFINFFYRNAVFYHFSDINVNVHKPPSFWSAPLLTSGEDWKLFVNDDDNPLFVICLCLGKLFRLLEQLLSYMMMYKVRFCWNIKLWQLLLELICVEKKKQVIQSITFWIHL